MNIKYTKISAVEFQKEITPPVETVVLSVVETQEKIDRLQAQIDEAKANCERITGGYFSARDKEVAECEEQIAELQKDLDEAAKVGVEMSQPEDTDPAA